MGDTTNHQGDLPRQTTGWVGAPSMPHSAEWGAGIYYAEPARACSRFSAWLRVMYCTALPASPRFFLMPLPTLRRGCPGFGLRPFIAGGAVVDIYGEAEVEWSWRPKGRPSVNFFPKRPFPDPLGETTGRNVALSLVEPHHLLRKWPL